CDDQGECRNDGGELRSTAGEKGIQKKNPDSAEKRNQRPYREVNASQCDHQSHSHCDDAYERDLPQDVDEVLRLNQDTFTLGGNLVEDRECYQCREGNGGNDPDGQCCCALHVGEVSNPAA